MVVTVQQSIPQNARGFFLRERDALNEQYQVQLKFPKGREFMYRDNQTMLMIGSQRNIKSMMPQVRRILFDADQHYQEFKIRQAYRKEQKARERELDAWVTVKPKNSASKKNKAPKKPGNAFAVLDGLFEQEQEQLEIQKSLQEEADRKQAIIDRELQKEQDAINSGLAPKPVKAEKCVMDFRAAIKKPAAPQEVVVHQEKNVSFSWGDQETDEEDFEDEDNGWEAGMSWGDMC